MYLFICRYIYTGAYTHVQTHRYVGGWDWELIWALLSFKYLIGIQNLAGAKLLFCID